MYSITGLRAELKMVSPAEARAMRDTMRYERQRHESEDHIAFLMDQTARGLFISGTQVHICVTPDGKAHIVNGNHTLEHVARGKVSIPLVLLLQKVSDEEEMNRIYARHDNFRPRNLEARLKATGQDDIFSVKGRWLETMAAAAGILESGLQYLAKNASRRDIDARINAMEEWRDELKQYVNLIRSVRISLGAQTIFRRGAIVASTAYTLRYQPSTAAEFITGMMEDDGLGRDDPRKRLLEWCRAQRYKGPSINDHIAHYRSAWNAFFEGRSLDKLYAASMTAKMDGTPLNKEKRPEPSAIKIGQEMQNGRMTTTAHLDF